MTTRTRIDPRKHFTPRFLPWILAAVSFAVYWFTLNRWVSPMNLISVARISGWTWLPEVTGPVLFLVTYPFRWLPAPQVPAALNLFSAACAALTLGLLARSVALLPHDRTEAQRRREHSDFSFLTLGSAWLPPVLAVAVCGLQIIFWENATNYSDEMFNLLLFAFVIWSFMEYRLDEREGRLYLASFVYGASLANNWGMLGFIPLFVTANVWIRGVSFFNLRFLKRMFLCGLLGLMFYLLLPLVTMISKSSFTLSDVLKTNLAPQFELLKFFFVCCLHPQNHLELVALFLAYLIPVCLMAIRWGSSFGDHSAVGMALTNFLFHLACAAFLFLGIWMAFDPPFSPRHINLGTPLLPLYYLGALSIGYFSGYFLLIFGQEPSSRMPLPKLVPFQRLLNPLVVVAVWALAAVAVIGLAYRNIPQIRDANDDTFRKYAAFAEENLPRSGGIMLSDDPLRLFLVEAALVRDHRAGDFMPLDTRSLNWPAYLRFLHNKFPQKWPELVGAKDMNPVNPLGIFAALTFLAKTNELYYLHPSYGYYFEQFYQEPHGLVYKLKSLPADTLLPLLPDKDQIARNDAFWSQVKTQAFASIERAVAPADPNVRLSRGERLLKKFHVPREPNGNAILIGGLYSRSLDFWGVQLQRAGELEKAAAYFALAEQINPDNVVAQINLQFNQALREGRRVPLDLSKTGSDQFGKYHDWNEVVNANGPFDEPSFCLLEGINLATPNGFYRQAAAAFKRVCELEPDNLFARLWLGRIYVLTGLPDRALEALREPLEQPQKFSLAKTNETELNITLAAAYFQKSDLAQGTHFLETEIALHPNDDTLLDAAWQAYLMHGLYTNALALVDDRLRLAPEDPDWLFKRGYVVMQLKDYDAAAAAFTRVLAIQTTNSTARFNRALAYLNSGKLDAAQTDYKTLQQSLTNAFQIAYGLGEIAWRQHETNEAVRNYTIYLANANTNTDEGKIVWERLRELKGH